MSDIKNKLDVIVIGELNVDIILSSIDGFPSVGKEILANNMSVTLGSSSAIFASNLSSIGAKVGFIGKVGDDSFAELVMNSLQTKKVDTSHILRTDSIPTGATVVLNYDQDRANITFPGAMDDLHIENIDFSFLSTARHMHFSSCFMQPGIKNDITELFRKSKELGLTTSLDTQWDPLEKWDLPLEKLLPWVDVFLPNAQEFKLLTRADSVEEGILKIKNFANFIVIKNGSAGCIGWDGENIIYQPAFKNDNVVDCIGAGDSFNAGYIMNYIDNKPFKKCLESGTLMGAINTTRAGGTGAFENIDLIQKISRESFNHIF